MSLESYKYTFRINASHANVHMDQGVHNHTFEISLYIKQNDESFVLFEVTETIIQDFLRPYSGVILNTIPPFDVIAPTVENIGEVFFTEISLVLENIGYQLVTLDISESPQRIFSISEEDLSEKNRERLHRSIRRMASEAAFASSNEILIPLPGAINTHPTPSSSPDEEQHVVPDTSGHTSSVPMTLRPASNLSFVLSILLMIAAGFVAMTAVRMSGIYPLGLDIHGHLFKSDLMFHEILKGNLYPLYTEFWYNGVQPFRYWAPLPYYTVAFLQYINSGDIMNAYLGFIWMSFSVGGFGWVLFGRKLGRPVLGAFFGIVWFILSDNLRVFFGEGNLPRMFIAMILPFLFYCLWQFVCYRRKKMIFPLIILMLMAILGHLMIAAMVGVATAIFLLLYSVANKRYRESMIAILAMFFAFAVAGIWLYASLVGGLASMSSDATATVMATQSSPLSESLNPLLRLRGGIGKLYLGLSIAIISLVGLFLSNRKSLSGFGTMFIIILGTSTSLTPLILLLPLSQYFWISRFTPIAYALFVVALFEWRTIKKPILVLMCAAILLDAVPSFMLHQYNKNMNLPATYDVISQTMDDELYTKAKEITRQRISLMDLSIMGPLPSYAFCTLEPKTQYVFGWAWQGAATAINISSLNESLEKENYLYTFDRNIELGADTVLVDKRQLAGDTDQKALISAAERLGYLLVHESEHILLFSLPVESTFGVLTEYSGLAIGTTAAIVPLILPYYHPGDKLTIDEYSVAELVQYDRIYLSGFFYNDKANAELLVRSIAEAGVLVYVDMSRIPSDPLTNRMTFLDISAQPITFSGRFPELISPFQTTTAIAFPEGYETWNTVYLTGLTKSDGYAWFEDTKLDYVGTGTTTNITFFGFNLLFHAYTSDDTGVKSVFNSIMELEENKLPERTIVPLDIQYETNKIIIISEYDNVNTTLAYQDTFQSEQPIRSMNQFLIVDQGTTVITLKYPYPVQGMAVSVIGIALEAVLIFLIYRKPRQIVSRKKRK